MSGPICPIEERWDFLLPWCAVLKGRIKFDSLECDTNYWGDVKNYLQVNLPYRHEETQEDEEKLTQNPQLSEEETFQLKFRKAREALALLSVVAHVDYTAWRCLLETYCGMDMQYEGSEKFDEKVEPKFVLFMDLEGRKSKESDALDLVKFCGVDQRKFPSQEYVRALEKIAVGTDYLMSRTDVKVPVRVNTASCMKISVSSLMAVFMDIQKAEQTVKEQWEIYKASHEKEDVALGKLRCTFVLEPMIADVTGCRISAELAEAMERLVTGNVWASQVAVGLTMVPDLENEAGLAKKVMRQLMASLFDNTRRPPELALTSYHSGFQVCSTRAAPDRLQFEKVHVQCAFSLGDMDMDALFSAIASSQTAKKFSLDIDAKVCVGARMFVGGEAECRQLWKWIAYAFYSKRAHSSIESLELTQLPQITTADVDAFTSVMTSDHPEEELFGCRRGRVGSRVATLKADSSICWKFDEHGRVCRGSSMMKFESSINSVRTFSDDRKGKWVNVLIPGFGRAYVRRADLLFTENSEQKATPGRITSLTMRFGLILPFFGDAVAYLLNSIGPSLRFLTLDGPSENLKEVDVTNNCPNLEEFSIRKGFVNVRFNFFYYHARNDPLPALNFDGYDIETLATLLSDASSSFTKCMRQLRVRRLNPVDFGRVLYDPSINGVMEALLQMLQKNTSLEYLQILLSTSHHKYLKEFRKYHLKPIDRLLKLPIESKVALLSVMSSKYPASTKKDLKLSSARLAFSQLNQNILAKIFAFCHSPMLRKVNGFLILDGVPQE
ncbi:hypothetical protein KRP22_013543 [Phytophthora ramorum]|nr:hypothetical protein KRP22_11284 [Phytophthora ramorum]